MKKLNSKYDNDDHENVKIWIISYVWTYYYYSPCSIIPSGFRPSIGKLKWKLCFVVSSQSLKTIPGTLRSGAHTWPRWPTIGRPRASAPIAFEQWVTRRINCVPYARARTHTHSHTFTRTHTHTHTRHPAHTHAHTPCICPYDRFRWHRVRVGRPWYWILYITE